MADDQAQFDLVPVEGDPHDESYQPTAWDKLFGLHGQPRYQTWPERAARGIISGATAPADALSGKLQVSDPATGMPTQEAVSRAWDATGALAGAGLPMAEKDAAGIFGGVLSKNPNMGALDGAKSLARDGIDPVDVWKATGWFQGADTKWRHEIPDTGMKIRENHPSVGFIDELIDHPALFEQYPSLKNVEFATRPELGHGAAAAIDQNGISFGPEAIKNPGTILHELQHMIQAKEGFAQGGTPDMQFKTQFDKAVIPHVKRVGELLEKAQDTPLSASELDDLTKSGRIYDTWRDLRKAGRIQANQNYHDLAGEVESRNVSDRLKLGYDKFPQHTEDQIRANQIVNSSPLSVGPRYARDDLANERHIDLSRAPKAYDPLSERHFPSRPTIRLVPVDHNPFEP